MLKGHRFCEMGVEARLLGAPKILRAAPPGQCHQHWLLAAGYLLAEFHCDFVATHIRQPNVEKDHVWWACDRSFDCGLPVTGDARRIPFEREEKRETLGGVSIVIHYEQVAWTGAACFVLVFVERLGLRLSGRLCQVAGQPARKPHDELRSAAGTVTVGLEHASVHLNELSAQRQSEPEPRRVRGRRVELYEGLKDRVQLVGGDADSVILDRDGNIAAAGFRRNRDNAASMQPVSAPSIRVFVIADSLIRWGLDRLVESNSPPCELLGGAAQLAVSVPILERQRADVIIDAVDHVGTEELATFCGKGLGKVILVTNTNDHAWLDGAILAGVRGVVRTDDSPQALLKAIDKVHAGEFWLDRAATSRIFMKMARQKAANSSDPDRSKIATLTWRERQTIAAFASDASVPGKVIAQRLCMSEHTLRNHLTAIYNKLDLSNRLDLYAYANRHGLQQLETERIRPKGGVLSGRAMIGAVTSKK